MTQFQKLICLIFVVLISGCTEKSSPVLRLGTNIWLGYEPLYLAREKGYLTSDKVSLIELSSASQVIQAYRNNLIDAAALTLDEVLLLLETGEQPKIVLVMDTSNGGDAIIGQSTISSLKDLKGKRIGVENNALGAYVIARALEIANIDKQTTQIIPLDINEQANAFAQKTVDAVVTFAPVSSKLLQSGGRLLFDSSQIPGEIVDVLIIRNEHLKNHAENIQHVLDAWYKSLDYMNIDPQDSAKILGKRAKMNVSETLAAYKGLMLPNRKENRRLLKPPELELRSSANRLKNVMLKQGLLNKNIDINLLF